MRDDDQPPDGAIALSEFYERSPLLVAQRQAEERLKAAQAAVPPEPKWFGGIWGGRWREDHEAWEGHPAVCASAKAKKEVEHAMHAVIAERLALLVTGQWLAWGHEDILCKDILAIPAPSWPALAVNWQHGIVRGPKPAAARFYGVRVAPAESESAAATALTGTIAAESRCREWLMGVMSEGTRPSESKAAYGQEAQKRFGISKRAFLRAWDAAINATGNINWRKPGRKPSAKSRRRIDTPK